MYWQQFRQSCRHSRSWMIPMWKIQSAVKSCQGTLCQMIVTCLLTLQRRSYTSLNGLQTFAPAKSSYCGDGCVPLEVLIDYRCESNDFDRLVPQTNATFHYDKFNRLRLRNNVTSVTRTDESSLRHNTHLHNETVRTHLSNGMGLLTIVFRIWSASISHGSLYRRATNTFKIYRISSPGLFYSQMQPTHYTWRDWRL